MAVRRFRNPDIFLWAFALVCVALSILVSCLVADRAEAQQIGGFVYSERNSSRPHGFFIWCVNTTGTTIPDGILVMADTTGTTDQPQVMLGKGVKPWNHAQSGLSAKTVVGVTIGAMQGYQWGRVLVLGTHPWVKVDATGISAMSLLRPSMLPTTSGAMASFAAADTAYASRPVIGIFQRYAKDPSTGADSLRAYVWVNTTGAMGGAK